MHQVLRNDTDGSIFFYNPERERPTNAYLTIYKPGGEVLLAETLATTSSVNTTISGSAVKGANSFSLSSSSGVIAADYYLVSEDGKTFEMECRAIGGTTFTSNTKTQFALTNAATFQGYKISYSLSSTLTDEIGDNYLVVWKYSFDDGSTYQYKETVFDVVASVNWYPTKITDVISRFPRIQDYLDSYDIDGEVLLRTAWDQKLIPLLNSKGMDITRVKDLEQLIPLHVVFVNLILVENDVMQDTNKFQQLELARSFVEEIDDKISSKIVWYDADQDLKDSGNETKANFTIRRVLL